MDDEPVVDDGELFARAVAGSLSARELALLGDRDAALVARSVGGDVEAFGHLAAQHYERVYRLACRRLNDRHVAPDVTQETFCHALRALRRRPPVFPVGCRSIPAWLGTICCNLCTDENRRQQRVRRLVSLDGLQGLADGEESVELQVEIRHAMRALAKASAALRQGDHEAFYLVYVAGYSRQDVAELLGEPASTIRSRVQRARGQLASAMKDQLSMKDHMTGLKEP